jgi:hypothetical protein
MLTVLRLGNLQELPAVRPQAVLFPGSQFFSVRDRVNR